MRNKIGSLLLLSALFLVAGATVAPASGDCGDNPTGTCCEYFQDSRNTAIGSNKYCAGFGPGCWECIQQNNGGFDRCTGEEPCDPGEGPSGFPIPQI